MLQGLMGPVLTASGTSTGLLDYVMFAGLLSYGLTMAGLFVVRRKRPEASG